MEIDWQQMLDEGIKHHQETREFSEKINFNMEKHIWDVRIEEANKRAKKEQEQKERMERIETKLDEVLSLLKSTLCNKCGGTSAPLRTMSLGRHQDMRLCNKCWEAPFKN